MDWLSFRRSVLTPAFGSELGQLGLGSDSAIPITDTGIIRTDTIDHIPTTDITEDRHTTGITGIEFITATIIIIITTTIKLTL